MSEPVELVVVGHVTRDLEAGIERIGGAASYAALAAAELGVRSLLLTAAPPGAPLLSALQHPLIELRVQPSREQTTFELSYAGRIRRLWVRSRADPIGADSLCGVAAPLAFVGPVVGEVDSRGLGVLQVQRLVLGLQGWLRELEPDGAVKSVASWSELALPPGADLVLSSDDHPEADALARKFSADERAVLVTRGTQGVTLWKAGISRHFPAPRASEVDPTGAGDVFGVVYAIRRQRGDALPLAIERAQLAAARSVEGPGLGRLGEVKHSIMKDTS